MKLEWEPIESGGLNLSRAKVFGGWLIMIVDEVMTPINTGYNQPEMKEGYEWRTALTFVPDPKHEWNQSKEEKK